ncbi:SIR2 family protein [Guyparkeria hydrothermalis]|uniref:anti-phage defense-associated sirtuin Dsr1 n=2 Tax=Guyparkeria TaxID=2035712 RepID=UPI002020A7E4|nr:anti-phage defense-associated sirtuin Dsr1 [Guyparkeria hydrothermalis]MCL7750704.1 SIR2 family protein [Guyparkeria hydrothermalis]
MQFVPNGPDVPDLLLEAHEEGRVVFFCGAGVSYPAGLPGFQGLVDGLYERLGTTLEPAEQKPFEHHQYDVVLDQLERRLPGQRLDLRKALAKILQPDLDRDGALDTHAALLRLGRSRDGALRLVTTNFDRLFEHAGEEVGAFDKYMAPMLPIPKNSRWDGVVYLHGRLPDEESETALHKLVLTSGDFGLAYLTERWAARFVSELFRNYVVCFVGYSIDDPVLRYMMDALAADRMLGEATPQAYAFGASEPEGTDDAANEWVAKGVVPVLYELPTGSTDHSALHDTLRAWADTYRDGTFGKERIVTDLALTHPSSSSHQDNFVGRMLWAISDKSGLPAKRFADFDPVPPFDWLTVFSSDCYRHDDLRHFGVSPAPEKDERLSFSLVSRPTPYQKSTWMALVSAGDDGAQWDAVMFHMARWLTRYLDEPELILWLARRGGQVHERLLWLIEERLNQLARLERDKKTSELEAIRTGAPKAIPRPGMQALWRLFLGGRVKSPRHNFDLFTWNERLEREGLAASLRLELRRLLEPKVKLRKPFRLGGRDEDGGEDVELTHLVNWELSLAADHVASDLLQPESGAWGSVLPLLLEDFQQLLRDALDLQRELGGADEDSDSSVLDMPSIAPHWQNRRFRDWVVLIELLRDAWLSACKASPGRAKAVAQGWFDLPYPVFKRLALFALSQGGEGAPLENWVDWLASDGAWWFWSPHTHRETMRLLVLQGADLAPDVQLRLERLILGGPPRRMYSPDLNSGDWQALVDRAVWLRLAKLQEGGARLGEESAVRLSCLQDEYPELQMSPHQREEFLHWMSGTGDPDFDANRVVDIAPRNRDELAAWLKEKPQTDHPLHEDDWWRKCRKHFCRSFLALCDLAEEDVWPLVRWREAFQAWSSGPVQVKRSWRYAAPFVLTMPDFVLQENARSITNWIKVAAESTERHEQTLIGVGQRILDLPLDADSGIRIDGEMSSSPVMDAINHPIGHVVQALLAYWFRRSPKDGDGLPDELRAMFSQVCDDRVDRYRHGRVLLASRLIALYRVDRDWTRSSLLPLFDWGHDVAEARAAWEGFLWSPRLYLPLVIEFKEQLLLTATHFEELGEHKRQFATFLTYVALGSVEGYSDKELRDAIGCLPQEGLEDVAKALAQALVGAGDQSEEYWRNRVLPFLQKVWPKSRELASSNIAESFSRLCVASSGEFPAARAEVDSWLSRVEHPEFVVRDLEKSGLASRFPEAALSFLDRIIVDQPWGARKLGACLIAIEGASPSLREDHRFRRLYEYARQHGL